MSDVSRYLPLSQRPRNDESGVSGDWASQYSVALAALADRLDRLSPADWEAASGRPGRTVRETVGDLEWRLSTGTLGRARAASRRLLSPPRRPRSAAGHASAPPAELVAALRSAAAGGRRRPLRDLAVVVVASLDVDPTLPVDRLALGAVALARSLSAPLAIRAVLRGVTLRASDAGWSVGHGATVRAPAADIVRFLYGRTGVPANTMEGTGDPRAGEARETDPQGRDDG